MDTKICSILMKLLAAMIAMLCMAHGLDTEEAGSVESGKELDLQRLKRCSNTELREQLKLRFKRNDFIGLQEIMNMEEVYSQCKVEKSDAYFVFIGLMVTYGGRQARYEKALSTANLIMPKDEVIVKELIHEMVTGKVRTELNRQLALLVIKKMEENLNNGGQARAQNEEPPNVVYHIASNVGAFLPSEEGRWERVMKLLLDKSEIRNELVNGKYNKELMKMFDKDMALKSSFCDKMIFLENDLMMNLVDNNKVLAVKIMVNLINDGFGFHGGLLSRLMQEEKIRRLYSEDEAFERMRMDYTASGELLCASLVTLAKEGKLDKLLNQTIKRLIRTCNPWWLHCVLITFGRKNFVELQSGKELESVLRHMAENQIKNGCVSCFEVFWLSLETVEFEKLLDRGDFDTAIKEGVELLFLNEDIKLVEQLIGLVYPRFAQLLGSGELDTSLKRGLSFVVEHGSPETLKLLVENQLVRQEVFNKWKGAEEIETALKKRRIDLRGTISGNYQKKRHW